MRTDRTHYMALATGVVAFSLLAIGKSQAQTIVRSESEPANVERILGLVVNEPGQDSIWNVDFLEGPLQDFYGPFPGTFTFTTSNTAENAVDAINAVLNSVDDMPGELTISSVGPPRELTETPVYNIAFESIDAAIPTAKIQQGFRSELDLPWERTGDVDFREFFDVRIYAVFSPVPEPNAGLTMCWALPGSARLPGDGGARGAIQPVDSRLHVAILPQQHPYAL